MSRRLAVLAFVFSLSAAALAGKAEAFTEERVPWQPGMDTLFPLPEVEGVVPWDVLGEVEMIFEGIDLVPTFGDSVKALEGQDVRMVGFLMPLDDHTPDQTPGEARQFKVVGTRPLRPDGIDKVTGRARFGADMSAPGMLIGRVLRSPHAHARMPMPMRTRACP